MLSSFFSWYFSRSALPYWCILLLDCIIIVVSGFVSTYFFLGGDGVIANFWHQLLLWITVLPLFMVGMRINHTYSGIVRYSSFVDLMRVALALLIGVALTTILMSFVPEGHVRLHYRVLALTFIIAIIGQWSVRILAKYIFDTSVRGNATKRVFIYGVREGGASLAKSIRNQHPLKYLVKGFMTEETAMVGRFLSGIHVHDTSLATIEKMQLQGVSTLFVSPLCNERFRNNTDLVNALIKADIKIMMMSAAEEWDGKTDLNYSQLKEVDIEDLLPRDKIEVNLDAIGKLLQGRRILITGAAGSIGSEMVRQIAKFCPAELILIDQAETPMHDMRLWLNNFQKELQETRLQNRETRYRTIVGNIANQAHMEQIFSESRPEYVFHAAAYKHVPMMEDNPAMAIQNNVYGTRVIADLAVKYGTKKFVMISTDKAVNPTNVMGCSKRICEIYCQSLNKALADETVPPSLVLDGSAVKPKTQFITTRFGNVLGSNGSVIPIFKEQIRKGGPVTVTHPDIIRFFMLIPEACQLVLEAGTMGHGGEIFVFDMGKPVRIADLAQRMIDLSGAHNIEIKFTGLRDGEKLFEEVLNHAEQTKPTVHPKIKVASVREYPYDLALQNEKDLYDLSLTFDDMSIVKKMKEIVPEYKSQHSKYQALDK